jgi:hypothetical protein
MHPESREGMTGKYNALDPNNPIWEDRRAHVRISSIEVRLDSFEKKLDANTLATQTIADNTTELVKIIKGAKGLRELLVWLAPIFTAIAAIYVWIRSHP